MENVKKIEPSIGSELDLEPHGSEAYEIEQPMKSKHIKAEQRIKEESLMTSEPMEPLLLESLKQEPIDQGLLEPLDELCILQPSVSISHAESDRITTEHFSFIKTEHTETGSINPEQFSFIKTEHSYILPCGGIEVESKGLDTLSNLISSDSVSHQVICSLCKRSFLNKAGLQRHIQYMHCIITNGQDSLVGCDEYSKSTGRHQRNHEKHVQNERDKRAYLRKMFVCLQKVITTCKKNTVSQKENECKEEQGSSLASYNHILGIAIKLVHNLQAREIDLKAEKRILLEHRSSLAEHYLNLRNDQDIPICRAFLKGQNEEQYLQDCLSRKYTGCFYPRVRLLDISRCLISRYTLKSVRGPM